MKKQSLKITKSETVIPEAKNYHDKVRDAIIAHLELIDPALLSPLYSIVREMARK